MAPPADQGTGNLKDNLRMQPANGLWDPEDDIPIFNNSYMMPADNNLWSPEDNPNLNSIFISPYMIQAENGLQNPENNFNFNGFFTNPTMASSNHVNIPVANRITYGGYTGANIPRGEAPIEKMLALFTPPFQVSDSNIEPQHLPSNAILAEKGQDEPEYVMHASNPHVTKRARKNSGPSSEEWEKRKPEIYRFYVDDNYTLEATKEKMDENGFHAKSVPLFSFSLRTLC